MAKGKALLQRYDSDMLLLSLSTEVPACHSERLKEAEGVEVLPILSPLIQEMNLMAYQH